MWSLLIWVAIQISRPATPAAISVVVARVSPYIRSPRSVDTPLVPRKAEGNTRFLEVQTTNIERAGVQLCPELLERPDHVVAEDVLHHPDLGVVVERQVHMLMRDEVTEVRWQAGQRTARPS